MNYPSIAQAQFPQAYIDAIGALKLCAKHFTPERYSMAATALQKCIETDDTAIMSPMDALATNAKMAADNALMRLAAKVEQQRQAWKQEGALC